MRTLKGIRNDLGLNQDEMAEALGISLASYQRYENFKTDKVPFGVIKEAGDMAGIEDLREIKYKR